MLDKFPIIDVNYSQKLENKLMLNGELYSVETVGLLFKHQCLVSAGNRVWLTIKKRGKNDFRLLFSNGHKYQLEVLTYTTLAFVFYDNEDNEIFRLTKPADSASDICLLVSEEGLPREEYIAMVAWGIYYFHQYHVQTLHRPAA